MEQLHKTRGDIQREEKCSPAFVLLNVDMLMRTDAPKDRVISANDYVTKGNCDKPRGSRKKRNDPIKLSASDFNHAFGETYCRPRA